jgi:hypothetical protein
MSKTIHSPDQFAMFDAQEPPVCETPRAQVRIERPPTGNVIFIHHEHHGVTINQRPSDGYIDATAMCAAYGTEFYQFSRTDEARAFLNAANLKLHICGLSAVETRRGRGDRGAGSWVHPRVAIRLAMWLDAEFAWEVTGWVEDWLRGRDPDLRSPTNATTQHMIDEIRAGFTRVDHRLGRIEKILTKAFQPLKQLYRLMFETWLGTMLLAFPKSTRGDQAGPPPTSGQRRFAPSGRPPLVHPRECRCGQCNTKRGREPHE